MMLYVSLEQEKAVRNLFTSKGWGYRKPGKGYCKENKMQGCHSQGKMSGKRIFFQVGKVREFCGWTGKFRKDLKSQGKVREFENNGYDRQSSENLYILSKRGKGVLLMR